MEKPPKINRREFIGSAAAASFALTTVPRHVLGGPGYIPPSDKITLGYIGCGTQGIREMAQLLQNPDIQIVAVCDPNKYTTDYVDWSLNNIRDTMRRTLQDNSWGEGIKGIPGGRDLGLELVQKYYGRAKASGTYRGCSSYEDFRELLEKERDMNTIKIMTPDHLHAAVAVASMKKGKHVVTHKPIANRMKEAKITIETAKSSGLVTHLLAWSHKPEYEVIKKWIDEGRIGRLMEIHNWSNRPVWPQWQTEPADRPPVPEGLNWDLWLGPVPERPYHPSYTHAVFRGWYDFGAGSIADMGHYSLFPLFLKLGISAPAASAEAYATTTCAIRNNVAVGIRNDAAFPLSCIIRFRFRDMPGIKAFDLFWYDGGMKPATPEEVLAEGGSLEREGLMFVGEKGKIIGQFRGEKPVLYIDGKRSGGQEEAAVAAEQGSRDIWIDAIKNNSQSPGSFIYAGPVTETILLGGVALRAGRRVEYDSSEMKITNYPEADKFLTREYRPGWEL
ncbi:MAG TPA: Gfo/Idh/MocA family oxidoreductase [Bacteroidales bacterium]|nr:Gfo/Idh/MocA family oxidoreductase [Bacteroidales bacterium]HPJ59728.1 Gfo/Idh/MocA family oxidoreductase [Bacteroidales bacterium]HRW84083.1 Gfo/Idh/MocA family oxidoreductase [Bacteroidales bacterium]